MKAVLDGKRKKRRLFSRQSSDVNHQPLGADARALPPASAAESFSPRELNPILDINVYYLVFAIYPVPIRPSWTPSPFPSHCCLERRVILSKPSLYGGLRRKGLVLLDQSPTTSLSVYLNVHAVIRQAPLTTTVQPVRSVSLEVFLFNLLPQIKIQLLSKQIITDPL
jgi:hypothetical protein